MKKLLFETEPCGRCAGSGWYSYCQMWGHTCFECGVRPHDKDTGRRFTKAAKAAQSRIHEFIAATFNRRADQIVPGMWLRPAGGGSRLVESVTPSGSGIIRDGVLCSGVDIQTKGCTYVYQPESVVAVIPSVLDWDAMVVPFVRTLVGVSVHGDVPVGVYKLIKGRNGKRVEYVARAASLGAALALVSQQGPRVKRAMFIAPITEDAGRGFGFSVAA